MICKPQDWMFPAEDDIQYFSLDLFCLPHHHLFFISHHTPWKLLQPCEFATVKRQRELLWSIGYSFGNIWLKFGPARSAGSKHPRNITFPNVRQRNRSKIISSIKGVLCRGIIATRPAEFRWLFDIVYRWQFNDRFRFFDALFSRFCSIGWSSTIRTYVCLIGPSIRLAMFQAFVRLIYGRPIQKENKRERNNSTDGVCQHDLERMGFLRGSDQWMSAAVYDYLNSMIQGWKLQHWELVCKYPTNSGT